MEAFLQLFVRFVLILMGVVVFGVATLALVKGAYVAGGLTIVAILAVALAGLLPRIKTIRLPFEIELEFWRPREDEDEDE